MRSRRASETGFTLLETLLAAALLAIIALPTISAFSNAARQDGPRIAQFEKHEFAISLLEERIATNDFSATTGIYEDHFTYEVTARPYDDTESTRYDELIAHTLLTIIVDTLDDAKPVAVTQVVAHTPAR